MLPRNRLWLLKKGRQITKKKIFETDEKCHHKVANTLPLPTEQLKKYVEIDKKIEYQNLVHGKHGLNRYGSLMILY